jgi:UDP-glucose 4-epimerase
MPDKILIIGAAGFVGRHLANALAGGDRQVLALTRSAQPDPIPGVEQIVGAFDRPDDYRPFIAQASVVVHAASASTPGSTAGRPLSELSCNLAPTLALIEALQEAPDCRLVYLSSGGTLYGNTGDAAATEDSPLRPRSYHGAGKAAAEHFIRAWAAQFRGRGVILRPSNLYGPGQCLRSGFGVIPAAFDRILRNEPLTIWGDGQTVRDFLYIDDFIDLCLAVIAAPMTPGVEVVNAASGIGITLDDLLRTIEAVTGRALPRHYDPTRPVDLLRVTLDVARARSRYAWRPATSLAAGLARTWEWYRSSHP